MVSSVYLTVRFEEIPQRKKHLTLWESKPFSSIDNLDINKQVSLKESGIPFEGAKSFQLISITIRADGRISALFSSKVFKDNLFIDYELPLLVKWGDGKIKPMEAPSKGYLNKTEFYDILVCLSPSVNSTALEQLDSRSPRVSFNTLPESPRLRILSDSENVVQILVQISTLQSNSQVERSNNVAQFTFSLQPDEKKSPLGKQSDPQPPLRSCLRRTPHYQSLPAPVTTLKEEETKNDLEKVPNPQSTRLRSISVGEPPSQPSDDGVSFTSGDSLFSDTPTKEEKKNDPAQTPHLRRTHLRSSSVVRYSSQPSDDGVSPTSGGSVFSDTPSTAATDKISPRPNGSSHRRGRRGRHRNPPLFLLSPKPTHHRSSSTAGPASSRSDDNQRSQHRAFPRPSTLQNRPAWNKYASHGVRKKEG